MSELQLIVNISSPTLQHSVSPNNAKLDTAMEVLYYIKHVCYPEDTQQMFT